MSSSETAAPRRRLMAFLPALGFLALVGFFAAVLIKEEFFGHDPATLPSAMIDKPAPDFTLPALLDDKQIGRAHV